MDSETIKKCSACKKMLIISFFRKEQRRCKTYVRPDCKECVCSRNTKNRNKNRDKYNAYTREWANINRDRIRIKQRKWYKENRESEKVRRKKYRQEHPEFKIYENNYKKNEPEKIKARAKLKYNVRAGNIQKPDICEICRKFFSKQNLGGHHNDYNKALEVIWVCAMCHKTLHQ